MNSSSARQSHWPLTILMGASSLLSLFLPLVLVRVLNPTQMGFYKLFFLYSATAPWILLSAGLSNGLYYWAGQNDRRKVSFEVTWTLQLLWSFGVLVLGALLWPWVRIENLFSLESPLLFALLVVSIAVTIPSTFLEEARIASGQTRWAAWYGTFWEFAKAVTLMSSGLYFRSVTALACSYCAVIGLKLLCSSFLTWRLGYARLSLSTETTRAVLRYALPSSLAAALSVIIGYCDQFILGQKLPAAEFAVYSLGCLSVPPLLIFEQSVNKVLIPRLSESLVTQPIAHSMKLFRRAVMDLGLWLTPAAAGLFFFAGPITRLLFTSRYPEAEVYLQIYSASYLLYIIPYDAWARAEGRSTWILKTIAVFSVVSFVATFAGASWQGAGGGARAALILFLASQAGLRLYSLWSLKNQQVSLRKLLPGKALLRFLLSSLVIGVITQYLSHQFEKEIIGLLVMGTVFWILYFIACVPWTAKKERMESPTHQVLMLTQYLHIGGLEKMILNLSQALLQRQKWTPSVFVYDEIPGVATLDAAFAPIPVQRWNKPTGFSLKLVVQIVKHCRAHEIDVIHAHDMGPLIYGVLAKFLSLGRLRLVYTQHSFVHFQKGKKYRVYEGLFVRFADQVITVSPALKEVYVEMGLKPEKVRVIENGIPFGTPLKDQRERQNSLQKVLPQLSPEMASSFVILNLARLHPGKGQEQVLDLWQLLPENIQEQALVVFVGSETSPQYQKQLEQKAAGHKNHQRLLFVGPTLDPETWIRASHLLISASLEEGLPLSPLEALAMGVPAFLSEIPGHALLRDEAEIFSLQNLTQAAQALSRRIEQKDFLPRALPEKIRQRFDVQKMAAAYEELYFTMD